MSSIVEVSTTENCPLKCDFCPQDKLEEAYVGPKLLTQPLFEKCLDNMVPGDAIHFSGFVEPCVNPQIIELMQMALGRGHEVSLYTTGRGLNVDQAKIISKMTLDKCVLHLPDAAGHLEHARNNVAVLDALSTHPRATCMAMGHKPHSDVTHIWDKLVRNLGAMHDRAGNVDKSLSLPVFAIKHHGPVFCSAAPGLDHPVLLPDGRLALCCCDYGLDHIVGDLSVTPLSEILRGDKVKAIVELQRGRGEVICRSCSIAKPL